MAAKGQKAYFGLPWIVSVILCIFLGWPLGVIVRLIRGKYLGAILALILPIFWLIDFITILLNKDITVLG
ncbi:MAG: hypothetical protein LBT20_05465 [Clostridiales bacterium]|jgi:hypothetical protein|nr:hypothetical protein [Clostridiales bacterium]